MKLTSPRSLLGIAILMFGFGFLLVPLYSVFCEITGINGKTSGRYEGKVVDGGASDKNVSDRLVTIQFVANKNANVHWPFKPESEQLKVLLGARQTVVFNLVNPTQNTVIAQAVPSVSPSEAAPFLHKIECFCFQQQRLKSGEEKGLALEFFIDPNLPKHITKLTLSYTLFDITQNVEKQARSS